MSIIKEFKEFAVKGNVVDMAVGIIIGAAFGKIVSSLVGDLMMPILGVLVAGLDFSNLHIIIKEAQGATPAVLLNYGMFIQTIINFLIVAFSVFLLVKGINTLRRKQEQTAPVQPPAEERLLMEIRDLLKSSVSK